jgi:hypothetical protein
MRQKKPKGIPWQDAKARFLLECTENPTLVHRYYQMMLESLAQVPNLQETDIQHNIDRILKEPRP